MRRLKLKLRMVETLYIIMVIVGIITAVIIDSGASIIDKALLYLAYLSTIYPIFRRIIDNIEKELARKSKMKQRFYRICIVSPQKSDLILKRKINEKLQKLNNSIVVTVRLFTSHEDCHSKGAYILYYKYRKTRNRV